MCNTVHQINENNLYYLTVSSKKLKIIIKNQSSFIKKIWFTLLDQGQSIVKLDLRDFYQCLVTGTLWNLKPMVDYDI